MNKVNTIIKYNEKWICVILAIIIAYWVSTIDVIKPTYININYFDIFYIIIWVVCYFAISKIFSFYKWIFNKILEKDKFNIELLFPSLLVFGGILSVVIVTFLLSLNYHLFKINRIPILASESENAVIAAESFLIPFMSIIPYVIILCTISVLLYQLYKLHKLKISFFMSLSAVFISNSVLFCLVGILIHILNIFIGIL